MLPATKISSARQPFQSGQFVYSYIRKRPHTDMSERDARTLSPGLYTRSLHWRALHRDLHIVYGCVSAIICTCICARVSWLRMAMLLFHGVSQQGVPARYHAKDEERNPFRWALTRTTHTRTHTYIHIFTHLFLFPCCCINARYPTRRGENNGDSIATRPLVAFTARAHISRYRESIPKFMKILKFTREMRKITPL